MNGLDHRIKLFAEVEKLFRRNIEHVADIEQHIERDRAFGRFDAAHMCSAYIDKLRKRYLRQPLCFSVVCDIKSQIIIFVNMLPLHSASSCFIILFYTFKYISSTTYKINFAT